MSRRGSLVVVALLALAVAGAVWGWSGWLRPLLLRLHGH
jgi:hypothetical protein